MNGGCSLTREASLTVREGRRKIDRKIRDGNEEIA